MGQTVRDVAAQYYAGLTNKSSEEGVKNFYEHAGLGDNPFADCALRPAELELLHA